ncbi:RMD1 family protein [Ekhidna sp.]|uniref:RMD1 family protein n=1 Tax=Ekhidna sp. TaxID=2608089 RepID=UPI003C7B2D66
MAGRSYTYSAYLVADKIDLASYRKEYPNKIISASSSELYYLLAEDQFMFILNYGVVVFSNMKQGDMQWEINRIITYSSHAKHSPVEDDLKVEYTDEKQILIGFNEIKIGQFDHNVNKMVMMNLAQTVAIDHYSILGEQILSSINTHTDLMRRKGRVLLSKRKALQFIGTTLSAKNTIAQHLYIMDSPDVAWENEFLDQLHKQLVKHFELASRYKALETTLQIVGDNLDVYLSYNNHRESSRLEWIIIILIVIEVIDTLLSKVI